MSTTRRAVLRHIAVGAGAGALHCAFPSVCLAQDDTDALTARIRNDLEQHAAFGRKISGSPGDAATADWIAGRLRRAGFAVEESEFDAPFFIERSATLTVGSSTTKVEPQAPVVPTEPSGVSARLALVEDTVGDVRDRIALLLTPFGRHAVLSGRRGIGRHVRDIADAGARAVVIVTRGPTGEAIALNAPEEPFVPIPTAVLAPKNADPFIAAARLAAEATLVLDGEATHRSSRNIAARLERGDRWIAISTPRTGWYDCVGERGTGTAMFLEMAEWASRRFPDLSVFLMNMGGHEYYFAGTEHVIDEAPPPEKTLVWAHVGAAPATRDAVERDGEWAMLDVADPNRTLMATESASDAARRAFAGLSGLEEPREPQTGGGELGSIVARGYSTGFAVLGIHRWMHTAEDTLERVSAELVVPVLRAHQRTIELIVSASQR